MRDALFGSVLSGRAKASGRYGLSAFRLPAMPAPYILVATYMP